jgi:D-serine dehydratase
VYWRKEKLERIGKVSVIAYSKQYPGICLEGVRNATENPQTGQPVSLQDLEKVLSKYI